MEVIGRILARMLSVITFVGMISVVLMMLQITIDVVGKLFFNSPLPATISLVSNYYMVIVAFLPLALVETRDEHITVEVVTEFLPTRAQYHLYSWTYLLSAAIFGALAYRSWGEARTAHESGTFMVEQGLKIITWPSFYLLSIGAGMMTLVVIYRWLLYVTGSKSGLGEVPTIRRSQD